MNKILLAALLACAGTVSAVAQTAEPGASTQPSTGSTATATAADMTEGEVRRIDKTAGKISIKHGEIKNLDMPPMTMVFQVKDAAMLDTVNVGDKVRFHVEKQGGALVVTELHPGQ